jgi:hypothetical protein
MLVLSQDVCKRARTQWIPCEDFDKDGFQRVEERRENAFMSVQNGGWNDRLVVVWHYL